MRCVVCGGATHVVYTRFVLDDNEVRRRRECLACKKRFISAEVFHHKVGEREKLNEPALKVISHPKKKPKVRGYKATKSARQAQTEKRTYDSGFYEPDDGVLSEEEMKGLGISMNRPEAW